VVDEVQPAGDVVAVVVRVGDEDETPAGDEVGLEGTYEGTGAGETGGLLTVAHARDHDAGSVAEVRGGEVRGREGEGWGVIAGREVLGDELDGRGALLDEGVVVVRGVFLDSADEVAALGEGALEAGFVDDVDFGFVGVVLEAEEDGVP